MSLPLTGPMLLEALRSQDMYLAGSFLMFMAFLTVVGVFISDIMLALLDPRIRLGAGVSEMTEQSASRGAQAPCAAAALRLDGAVRSLFGRAHHAPSRRRSTSPRSGS